MVCHLPFVIPIAGFLLFAVLPFSTALELYVPLTLLSLAIGVPGIRALAQPVPLGGPMPRPRDAVVVSVERRHVVIRWGDELWNADTQAPVAVGDRVTIVQLRGLTALVQPTHAATATKTTEVTA